MQHANRPAADRRRVAGGFDAVTRCLHAHVRTTYYLVGSTMGPHPYPMMVRDFQSVIGKETKRQILRREQRLPDYLVACVGGGEQRDGALSPLYC